MPPINQKKALKHLNSERKQERKKWKEQKLLKAATNYQKEAKERVDHDEELEIANQSQDNVNGSISLCNGPSYTLTIAVPGSILDNAQSLELRTYLAGQIGRAASIFCVDEVVVFDDMGGEKNSGIHKPGESSCGQLARLLQYLECPQYLRKHIFPLHRDLQYAGLLNPLDAPHHLRQADDFPYREGIVSHHLAKHEKGCYVNVGLLKEVCVDKPLIPGVRVTVKLAPHKEGTKKRYGKVVPPSQPRNDLGVYWGYTVRLASSLSDVFAKCPYQEGYDLTIGTSDKGTPLSECDDSELSGFKHILVVFGGLEGLEAALENDDNLNIDDVSLLFDKYLNTCPKQGSRTIRTEEAILISLSQLSPRISLNTSTKNVEL